jgi:D-3-phosphoglycerate dehydrogenase / 2-oxoglutarate reductase
MLEKRMATAGRITSFPKDQIKVLLLENVHATAREHFGSEGYQVEALPSSLPAEELKRKLADVHILGIRSKTQAPAEALVGARRLLSIGCFCIGTNQVDLDGANRRGIPVFNAPFSNTRSVAEMMIAEIISLARQLGDRSREVHEGKWRKVAAGCYEVRGKVLGIIGYGHIGRQLGVLAEALGLRVLFYDHAAKLPMGNNAAVPSLQELLAQSDFVSLHVPETPQTKNMIGAQELALMRRGSYLLNASRGTVVVIAALAEALKSGHLAGAAIDVYPEEPEGNTDAFQSALQALPNVILTPHIGGSTSEAQAAIGREVSTAITRFVNSGATTGAVNFPMVEVPQARGAHRILNVHRNVPGVLRDINKIVSDLNANIQSQMLATDPNIGYLIMDIDKDVSNDVYRAIAALDTNIRTRILY